MILHGRRNNEAPDQVSCGDFSESNRVISQTDVTGLFPKTSEWTLFFWMNSVSDWFEYLISYNNVAGNSLFRLYSTTTNLVAPGYIGLLAAGRVLSTTVDVTDGTWKFICVENVSDGGGGYEINLYVDNVLAGTKFFGPVEEADPSLYIGYCGDLLSNRYQGQMTGPFYYSRKLTNTELSKIYTYGASNLPLTDMEIGFPLSEHTGSVAYDVSGNDNHGTWIGTGNNYTTQEHILYSRQKGYSKYIKPGSDDLYVPYGIDGSPLVITPPAGYTLDFHAPA